LDEDDDGFLLPNETRVEDTSLFNFDVLFSFSPVLLEDRLFDLVLSDRRLCLSRCVLLDKSTLLSDFGVDDDNDDDETRRLGRLFCLLLDTTWECARW
jgi:hypothetical protein